MATHKLRISTQESTWFYRNL